MTTQETYVDSICYFITTVHSFIALLQLDSLSPLGETLGSTTTFQGTETGHTGVQEISQQCDCDIYMSWDVTHFIITT